MAYARAQIELSRRMADRTTYRDHLEAAARHSVQARLELEQLEAVPLPHAAAPVWEWFGAISERKTQTGFGPSLITWRDLRAWREETGIAPSALEREWLFELDRMYLQDKVEQTDTKPPARRGK